MTTPLYRHPMFKTKHDFTPLLHVLSIIQAHVDEGAYIGTHKTTNRPVLRYRQHTGHRIILGKGSTNHLAQRQDNMVITEKQACHICMDLGQIQYHEIPRPLR